MNKAVNDNSDNKNQPPILTVVLTILAIAGGVATVFSCIFGFIALTNPSGVQTVLIELYNIETPSPQTILVTVPVEITQPPIENLVVITATEMPATFTPEPVVVQAPGEFFEDDFEDGPDSLWKIIQGQTGMSNGKYTVISPFDNRQSIHMAILEGILWKNAAITIRLAAFHSGGNSTLNANLGILLRHTEESNDIGLRIHPNREGIEFATLNNGEWSSHAGSLVDGLEGGFNFYQRENEIRIEIKENTYLVFLNGEQTTAATIAGPVIGEIGLWFQTDGLSDLVEAYAARVEEITIESLP